jgi:ABC-type multidrug transport system fused ATPase/permease subunit
MNNAPKSREKEPQRLPIRRLYTTFYLPDWPWHLLVIAVVAGVLVTYTLLPTVLQRLTDLVVVGSDFGELVAYALWVALAFIGLAVLSMLKRALIRYTLKTRVLNRAQPLMLERLLACPLSYFETHRPGDLRNVISNIAAKAVEGVMDLVEPFFTVIQGLYLMLMMALISPPLSLVSLVLLASYAVFLYFFQRGCSHFMEQMFSSQRILSAEVDDLYRGFPEIKRNGLEQTMLDKLAAKQDVYFGHYAGCFKRNATLYLVGAFVGNLLPGLLLLLTVLPAIAGRVTPSIFVAIYTMAMLLVSLLQSLSTMSRSSLQGIQGWRNVLEILDTQPERSGGLAPAGSQMEWTQVTKVLRDVTLKIEPGEKVMICGRSGEGKSTVLKMLPGLLEADNGVLRVGGVEARQADPSALRSLVGFVPQEPYLFETSLRDNLAYGREIDEAEIIRVVRLVRLGEFLAGLPNGLDTCLGPDGFAVSGGEKARISLARAILRQPNTLILDEATAFLDSETEERIYKYLLTWDRTVIGVTHRLSALRLFPRVVVLADGKIVLDGPTEKVVSSPIFQELFAYQMEEVKVS